MRTVLLGERPAEIVSWLERRRSLGLDRFDEVWEGEYHVAPMAHSRHGDIDQQLAVLLDPAARAAGLKCLGAVNIGDVLDFRVPDRCIVRRDTEHAVFLPTAMVIVEIVSPEDETFAKFDFYFRRGVIELLVVDPATRSVAWFVRGPNGFVATDSSAVLDRVDDLTTRLDWPA